MEKKYIFIIIGLILLIALISFGVYWYLNPKANKSLNQGNSNSPNANALEKINELALEKRPYIILTPREDGHELNLTISNLKNGETRLEYELEYTAINPESGTTLLQGATGRIDFTKEPAPVTKKILLGSESKGKYRYDEGVTGGTLTLRFYGDLEYVLREDFTIADVSSTNGQFFSRDQKISLTIPANALGKTDFVLIMDTFGLPNSISQKVLYGPVGLFTATGVELKSAATLKVEGSGKVLGFDNNWQTLGNGGEEIKLEKLEPILLVE